jgi:hypothetical protein
LETAASDLEKGSKMVKPGTNLVSCLSGRQKSHLEVTSTLRAPDPF